MFGGVGVLVQLHQGRVHGSQEARTGLAAHNIYSKDITLGARYQYDKHWMFAAEVHDIKGAGALSINENDLRQTQKNWNMFTAQVSYQF